MMLNLVLMLLVEPCHVPGARAHAQTVTGSAPYKSVTVDNHRFTEYATPTVQSYGRSIVEGNRIWIASRGDEIMGLSLSGDYVSYKLPRGDCGLYNLRATSGGFYFTRVFGRTVGLLKFGGDVSERPVDRGPIDVDVDGTPVPDGWISYGADGTRWKTAHLGTTIERRSSDGLAKLRVHVGSLDTLTTGIVPDADGGAWLARYSDDSDRIIHMREDGTIDVVANAPHHCRVNGLTAAAEEIWFSCGASRVIGRVASNGAITTVELPYPKIFSPTLVFGDSRGLWIVDFHRVFRLNITESSPFSWNGRKRKGLQRQADHRSL